LLNLMKEGTDYLAIDNSKKKRLLKAVTEALLKESKVKEVTWSRGSMKAFSELDLILGETYNMESLEMRSVSLLFILCTEFRLLFPVRELEFARAAACNIRFDISKNQVTTPVLTADSTDSRDIPFDFEDFVSENFKDVISDKEKMAQIEMSYSQVILGCLFAQLRISMWDMMLPASDLQTTYTALGSTVHVSASSTPPEQNLWSLMQGDSEFIKQFQTELLGKRRREEPRWQEPRRREEPRWQEPRWQEPEELRWQEPRRREQPGRGYPRPVWKQVGDRRPTEEQKLGVRFLWHGLRNPLIPS
jgi:hypothetical protein